MTDENVNEKPAATIGAPVVDAHFHWYPRASFERLAERDTFPRVERVDGGYRYYFNAGRSFIPLPEVWFDLDRGLEAHRDLGAEATVVCTAGVLAGLLDQLPVQEAVEVATSYNEDLAKAEREHPGQVFGTALLPFADSERLLECLETAVGELGLRGVNLPPIAGERAIDAPELDPFYARVAELGVPLIIHPTDLVFDEVLAGYETGLQRSLGRLIDSSVSMLRLVFSGVLARYPALKVLQTHAGGVLPYQVGRIDKNARIRDLPELPSAYLRRTFVDTVAPQVSTIGFAFEFYGSDRVLYGTDYPCWSPKASLGIVNGVPLDVQTRSGLMRHNARALFSLPEPPDNLG